MVLPAHAGYQPFGNGSYGVVLAYPSYFLVCGISRGDGRIQLSVLARSQRQGVFIQLHAGNLHITFRYIQMAGSRKIPELGDDTYRSSSADLDGSYQTGFPIDRSHRRIRAFPIDGLIIHHAILLGFHMIPDGQGLAGF